ncbi:MAG TPA: GTP-binding protein [Ktedonobacterales bacterium]|nr:GTP-binding protein [Ktedonobacterales bacterium]
MPPHAKIPVAIVTGFLGSGKTTLISRILRDPAFARTAVIVNEFGEIGLDHELIASSDETLLALTTGCLCCAVRSDLVATLLDLQRRREAGDISFSRVLIETSGLADPAPILHALMTDRDVAQQHGIDGIATVVDALHGEATLDRSPEARRQAALADTLLLSKTDIAGSTVALQNRLAKLNPGATLLRTHHVAPAMLFTGTNVVERFATLPELPAPNPFMRPQHSDGIETFTLVRERPVPALALTLLLEALAEHCGARLLRLKGLVNIAEMPGQPAVIHGVQHVFSPPEFLERWPSADHTTRVVFIVQGVPRHFPARLLEATEQEVREEMEQQPPLR